MQPRANVDQPRGGHHDQRGVGWRSLPRQALPTRMAAPKRLART